jgi:hypothetical protein
MTSVVGLNASNLDTKRGICHTWTFWQLTASLCRCDRPLGSRQLAPHHRVQVQTTSLYGVSEDFVLNTATPRLSWSLVGYLP